MFAIAMIPLEGDRRGPTVTRGVRESPIGFILPVKHHADTDQSQLGYKTRADHPLHELSIAWVSMTD